MRGVGEFYKLRLSVSHENSSPQQRNASMSLEARHNNINALLVKTPRQLSLCAMRRLAPPKRPSSILANKLAALLLIIENDRHLIAAASRQNNHQLLSSVVTKRLII